MSQRIVYLDHAATTPVRPEARAAMAPFLEARFGNASSVHGAGRSARGALEDARERVAELIGAEPSEIVFTSGGTEADNLAVLGRWRADGRGVAVSAIEHSAVRHAAAQAAREGAGVTTVAVDEGGGLDVGALDEALVEPHSIVSVMWANNEVGTLQPVRAIAERCREAGTVFHTDAVQAVAHHPVSVREVACDLLSLSAHKFGGPQGVGALYVRRGVDLDPMLFGGGQEHGIRPGTSNVAGAVGLAAALAASVAELDREMERLRTLRDRLETRLLEALPAARVNGGPDRLPHLLSLSLEDVDPDLLLPSLDLADLALSSGSACHSGASSPSHVLVAMGQHQHPAVRFSLGWSTEPQDVDQGADRFIEVVQRISAVAR
jgi:cysteine desulfurase